MPDIFDTLATTKAKPHGDVFDQIAAKKTDVFDELAATPQPTQRDISVKRAGEAVLKGAASTPFVLRSGVESAVGAVAEGINQIGQNISRNVRGIQARRKYGMEGRPTTVNPDPVLGTQLNPLQRFAEGGRDAAETTMEDAKSGILKPSTGLEKALSGEFSQSSDPVSRALYGATQSVLPNVIGGPLGAGKSIAFLQTLSEAAPGYWAARDSGKDPIEALTFAGVSGTGTFFLEKLGLDAIAGRLPAVKAAMDQLGQSYIANAALAFAAEGTTEGLQQIYQNAVAKGYDDTIEVFQGVLESVVVGGLAGGMASPVTTAINRAQATDAPIPGVAEADQSQAKELVAGGIDPATVAAWSQAPDEATKQQILTDALKPGGDGRITSTTPPPADAYNIEETDVGGVKTYSYRLRESEPPASEQPLGEPTVQVTPPPAEKSVASAPPPLPDAAADLQAMTDDISRTRKAVPPDQFSVAEPPPDRAEEVSAVNQATSLLGKKVVWFKNNRPENIRFNGTLTDDTIFINVDAKQPYVKIAMHESLHRMKTEQPDLYGKFMAVVKTEGSGFDQFRNELLSAYKAQGIAVDESSDWVWEELAADTLGDRGQDKTFWSDLYLKSPEAVKAIVDTIQKVMATLSGQSQTPEMAKYFKDFQKVHDAAVSVMSEYAAARSTDASLTQKGSPAVSTDAAATLPASKKPTARKPTDTSKTNPALEAWRDETRSAGIRPDPVINEADMGGTIPPGTIRKDSRDTWDSALMRALNAGLITEDEAGQPETFQRLMAGENVTVKDDLSAETKHMMAKQEGELIDALKRGETVDEQAFKYFPAAEKFRNYGKTKDNPATVGGLEVYHDGKVWKARKPGGNFKKVEGAIAERLDAAMPGVAEDKVPFSIDRDQDAAYMKAVEAGDTATAQKMVDEAAKAAGYTVGPVWHGGADGFSVFDWSKIGQQGTTEGKGFYFSNDRELAGGYANRHGGRLMRVYLRGGSPIDGKKQTITKAQLRRILIETHNREERAEEGSGLLWNYDDIGSFGAERVADKAATMLFSSNESDVDLLAGIINGGASPQVLYDTVYKITGKTGIVEEEAWGRPGHEVFVATSANHVKLADPITRDDQGNVIPLSKRFNAKQDDIRFSIDDDLTAEFDKLYPEPEPARPKLAKRILDDPRYTEDAKNFAKSLVKEVRGLEEDAGVAGDYIDAEGTTTARAKVMAKQTGLKDSQAAVVAQMLHKTYDRLIRMAEKEGKPEEAREIARMNDELGAFITEQQQEGGRLTNAWKYNLTTASWDTASGMAATFEGMVERSNAKHPEVKTVEQQLELAQKTIQQVAKEAADKALSNESLKSTIAARDAEIETMKRRDALLAKEDKAGFESWDRNPARYKSLNDQLDAIWNAPDDLAGSFAEKVKLSIEAVKAKLAIDPAKYLDPATSEKLTKRTQAWIWQQKKAGKEYSFKEWRAWAESTYGKGLFNFDDANDIHKTATRLMGRAATMTEKGKRTPKLETLIRRGVKASGFSINEIVYQTATQQGATLKTLTERLVNELGYSATDAADLAIKINAEFRSIIAKRGQQMLEAKFRDRGTKPRGRTKNVLDDILKSIKLGALSDADIKAKLYDKYGLTTVSPEAEAKFAELAAKVADETDKRYNAAKAKGYTDAQIALQDDSVGMRTAKEAAAKYMASQVKHGLNDYAWSWVHFSLLSSPYTWLFNSVANNSQLLGITTARALQGIVKAPFDRGRTLRQLSNGLSAMIGATPGAFAEAYNTMVTGEGVIRGNDKFDSDPSKYNVFESSEFLDKHPVLKAPLVFVRRILQATDILSAMQLRELQSAMMTTSIAQSEGLTGIPLAERVAEMMGRGPLNMKKYESMADAEGLTGINRFRRINQLVENNREQDIRENASVFSAWHTFNSQMPRGFIGDAAMMLNNFALRNQDHPIVGIPARSLGLFVRISANVSNIILDYSPYGFERARRGKVRLSNGKTYEMNDLYEGLRADVVTQAAMGTAMMTTALLHALSAFMKWKEDPDKDKKNPDFSVYGPGPSDPALRQVWMEAGGRPWSIQFGNGNAIPYKWAAPVAIPLALVGLWMDGERFKKENEEEDSRVWRMTGGMAVGLLQYIMQQSPMTAMNSAFRAINGFGGKDEENRFRKYVTGFTGFAIPNFISWIDKSIDPTVYSANDWLSAFTKNVPFVRGNALMPSLNLFGEPIEYAPSERFLGDAKSDTEMMWLTNNNVGIAKPNRPYMVDYKTGKQHEITEEEYYKLIKYFGPRFREALRFAIPRMNNLTHDQKKERVTQLKSDAYEYAKFMLYKESGLQAETKEKAQDVEAWFERKNK